MSYKGIRVAISLQSAVFAVPTTTVASGSGISALWLQSISSTSSAPTWNLAAVFVIHSLYVIGLRVLKWGKPEGYPIGYYACETPSSHVALMVSNKKERPEDNQAGNAFAKPIVTSSNGSSLEYFLIQV